VLANLAASFLGGEAVIMVRSASSAHGVSAYGAERVGAITSSGLTPLG
jgi:hypothetical protein